MGATRTACGRKCARGGRVAVVQARAAEVRERGGVACPCAEVERARVGVLGGVQPLECGETRRVGRGMVEVEERGRGVNERELLEVGECGKGGGGSGPFAADEGHG